MKNLFATLVATFALSLAAPESEAKRFGGGGNLGKQRATPTQKEATPAPARAPTQQAAPAGAGSAAAKPGFMSRWGGLLAGLGIGAVLASLFGAEMGPIVGMILMMLLVAAIGFMLLRMFAGRREPAASPAMARAGTPAFSGIGSRVDPPSPQAASVIGSAVPEARPQIDAEAFLRVAKSSFIRLQAANDVGDLDDIRDYTTPEVYAEIAMQHQERGATRQKTEVVNLNAAMVETAIEGDYEIASVRFTGLLRENDAPNPEPFDEIWHVRKDRRDRRGSWLIAGIQQVD